MAWTAAMIEAMTIAPPGTYYPLGKYRGFGNSPLAIGPNVIGTLQSTTNEDVVIAHLLIDDSGNGENMAVNTFLLPNGQNAIRGFMPASVFASSSQNSPYIGLFYEGNKQLDVAIQNGVLGQDVVAGFDQDPSAGAFDGYAGGRMSQIFCFGSATAIGETVPDSDVLTPIVCPLNESVVLDKLIIDTQIGATFGTIDELYVTSILVGSRELVQGGAIPAGEFLASNPFNRTFSPEDTVIGADGQPRRVWVGPPVVGTSQVPPIVTLANSNGSFDQTVRLGWTVK